ncbi:MAG TPA: LysR family transcriptional regulator [Kofleriaceae bacterium]|nr:LysR family transcriptional regulator [Kofleriaceae bacterium]
MNVRSIDLNLLVLFDALFAERHLTRAAARVGLSQPAMSNALTRLRAQLDDPLFVRAPRGVEPTPRARALAGPVHDALVALGRALSPEVFDPETTPRTFTVMMNDIHEVVLGPALSARIASEAPRAQLRLVQGPTTSPEEALAGDVDIVLSPIEGESKHIAHSALYPLDFASLVRRDHPNVARRLTLARFIELEHVLVAPRGRPRGFVDEALARRGLQRRIARVVAHFMSAGFLVARSDYVVTLPSILARLLARTLPLRVVPLPLDVPSVTVGQFWSSRNNTDPGHIWLRGLLASTASAVERRSS